MWTYKPTDSKEYMPIIALIIIMPNAAVNDGPKMRRGASCRALFSEVHLTQAAVLIGLGQDSNLRVPGFE